MPLDEATANEIKGLITESLNSELGKTVNNMFTARLGTVEKKLTSNIEKALETLAKGVDEKLALVTKPTEGGDGGGGGKQGKKDLELEAMRRQLGEVQESLREQKERADAANARIRQDALQQTLAKKLAEMGQITGAGAELALATLRDRVTYGEDEYAEKLVFRSDDGNIEDLESGLKRWLKTDQAKLCQPASGTRGSGSRGVTKTAGAGGTADRDQATANAMTYLAKALQNEGVIAAPPDNE